MPASVGGAALAAVRRAVRRAAGLAGPAGAAAVASMLATWSRAMLSLRTVFMVSSGAWMSLCW